MDILFKKGMPGLTSYTKFSLETIEEMEPFKLLKSKENKELGIVVVSPFYIDEKYEINLSDELLKELDIKSPKEVSLYTTVTLNSDVKKCTTNLKAPIVVNNSNGLGEQIILQNDKYKIKHPIAK